MRHAVTCISYFVCFDYCQIRSPIHLKYPHILILKFWQLQGNDFVIMWSIKKNKISSAASYATFENQILQLHNIASVSNLLNQKKKNLAQIN